MPDKEKVIKGLGYCEEYFNCCDKCPYWDGGTHCTADLAHDAIALLKEQQEQIDKLLEESASNAEMAEGLNELLKEQEAVVRCKDCKWWDKKDGSNYGYCHACKHGYHSDHWEIGIYRTYKGDWFCADGERK